MNATATPLRIVALAMLLAAPLNTSAQEWVSVRRDGGPRANAGTGIAVDAAGNVYVAGVLQGRTTFGRFTLTSAGATDAFLVKYSPTGRVIWARSDGGPGSDYGYGVALDGAGNAYVTGFFRRTATFGDFTLTSAGRQDVFVAKYSPDGDVLWARSDGGTAGELGRGIAVDEAGSAYVTGWFDGAAAFGDFALTSSGRLDAFVARYSPDGDVLWAQRGGGNSINGDFGCGIAVDTAGNAYIAGFFHYTATFGSFTLPNAGNADVFFVKYSPEGDVLWARSGGGVSEDFGRGVALDTAGNAYVTGYFHYTATFGDFTLTAQSSGYPDVLMAKYSPEGNVLWARGDGGASYDAGYSVAVDTTGNAYVTGLTNDTATFGAFTLVSNTNDVLIANYSPEGDVLGALSGGSAYFNDSGQGVAVDTSGSAYVTGLFEHTAIFGDFTLTSAGLADVFIAKYGASVFAREPGAELVEGFALSEAHPNPFFANASLTLEVAEPQRVTAEAFDMLGRHVALLHDGLMAAGTAHVLAFEAGTLPSGLYVVRVTGERFTATRRVALVR